MISLHSQLSAFGAWCTVHICSGRSRTGWTEEGRGDTDRKLHGETHSGPQGRPQHSSVKVRAGLLFLPTYDFCSLGDFLPHRCVFMCSWLYREATVQDVQVNGDDSSALVSVIISTAAYGRYKKLFLGWWRSRKSLLSFCMASVGMELFGYLSRV